ncbi:MAG: hypothetical protein N2509_09140, partial [Treponemataceae bacterium]|nr:hypothetical protein [Treponemataceae bacterium]
MNSIRRFSSLIFLLILTLCPTISWAAPITYDGLWTPTDGDVNEVRVDYPFDLSMYIFDQNKQNNLLVLDKTNTAQTIYFKQENNIWYAYTN